MTTNYAGCLSHAERMDMQDATRDGRKRPPKRERDAQKAERAAEIAATLLYLQTQGWKDWSGNEVAQCPRCASIGTRFVSRALREGGPRVLACVDCALGTRQT